MVRSARARTDGCQDARSLLKPLQQWATPSGQGEAQISRIGPAKTRRGEGRPTRQPHDNSSGTSSSCFSTPQASEMSSSKSNCSVPSIVLPSMPEQSADGPLGRAARNSAVQTQNSLHTSSGTSSERSSVKRHTFQFQEVQSRPPGPSPASQGAAQLAEKSGEAPSTNSAGGVRKTAVGKSRLVPGSGGNSNSKPAWWAGPGPRYSGSAGGPMLAPSSAPATAQPRRTRGAAASRLQMPTSPRQESSTASGSAALASGEVPSPRSPRSVELCSTAASAEPSPQAGGGEESETVTIRGGRIATHSSRGGNSPLGGLISPGESRMSVGAPTRATLGRRRSTDRGLGGVASPTSPSRAAMISPPRRTVPPAVTRRRGKSVTAAAASSPSGGSSSTKNEGKRRQRAQSSLRSTRNSAEVSSSVGDARVLRKEARGSCKRVSGASAGPLQRSVATSGTSVKSMQSQLGVSRGSGAGTVSTESGSVGSGSAGWGGASSRQNGSAQLCGGPMGTSSTFQSVTSPSAARAPHASDSPSSLSFHNSSPNPTGENPVSALVFFPKGTASLPLESSPGSSQLKAVESLAPPPSDGSGPTRPSGLSEAPLNAFDTDATLNVPLAPNDQATPPGADSSSIGATAPANGVTFDVPTSSEDTPVLNQTSPPVPRLVLAPHSPGRPLEKPPPIVGIPAPSVSNASSPTQSPRLSPHLSPPGMPFLTPHSQSASLNASPSSAAGATAPGSPGAAWGQTPPSALALSLPARRMSYPAPKGFAATLPFTPREGVSFRHSTGAAADALSTHGPLLHCGDSTAGSVAGQGSFLPISSNPLASGCLYKSASGGATCLGGALQHRALALDAVDSCVSNTSHKSSHRSLDSCALPGCPDGTNSSCVGSPRPALSRHGSLNAPQHAWPAGTELANPGTGGPGAPHLAALRTRAAGTSDSGSGSSPHKPAPYRTGTGLGTKSGVSSGLSHCCPSVCSSLAAVNLLESTTDESKCLFDSLSVTAPPPAANSSRFDQSGSLLAESCTSSSQPTSHLHRGPHSHTQSHSPRSRVPSVASPTVHGSHVSSVHLPQPLAHTPAGARPPSLQLPTTPPSPSHLHLSAQHAGLQHVAVSPDRLSTVPSSRTMGSPTSPTPSSQLGTNPSQRHSTTTSPKKPFFQDRSSGGHCTQSQSGSSARSETPDTAPPTQVHSPRLSPRDSRRYSLPEPMGAFPRPKAALSASDAGYSELVTGLDPETMSDFAKRILSERSIMPFPTSDSAAYRPGRMYSQQLFASPHSPPSARQHLSLNRRSSATNPTTAPIGGGAAALSPYDFVTTASAYSGTLNPVQQPCSTGSHPYAHSTLGRGRPAAVLAHLHSQPQPQPQHAELMSHQNTHEPKADGRNSEEASSHTHTPCSSAPLSVTAAIGVAAGSVSAATTSTPSSSPRQTPASSAASSPTAVPTAAAGDSATPQFPPEPRLSPPLSTRSSIPSLDSAACRDVANALEGPNIQPRRGITRSASVPPPCCDAWPFDVRASTNYRPRTDQHLDIFGGVTDPSLTAPGPPINPDMPGLVTSESGPHLALQYIGTAPPPRVSTAAPQQPPDFDAFFRTAPSPSTAPPPDFDAFFRSAPAAQLNASSSLYPSNPMFGHAYNTGPNAVMSSGNSNGHLEPTSGASAASSLARSPTHPFRPLGATTGRRRSSPSMLHAFSGGSFADHAQNPSGHPSPLAPLDLHDMHDMHLPPGQRACNRDVRGTCAVDQQVQPYSHRRSSTSSCGNIFESSGVISPSNSLAMHLPHALAAEEGSVVDASASVSMADTSAFSVSATFMKSSGALATGSDCSLRHWKRSNLSGGDTFVSLPLPEDQEASDLGGSEYTARSGSMHDVSTHGTWLPSQLRSSTHTRRRSSRRRDCCHTDAADSMDSSSGSFTRLGMANPPRPGSPSGLPPPAPRSRNRTRTASSLGTPSKPPRMQKSSFQDVSNSISSHNGAAHASQASDRINNTSRSSMDSLVTPTDSPTVLHGPWAPSLSSLGRGAWGTASPNAAEVDLRLFEFMGPACEELQDIPLVAEVLRTGGRQGATHLQFAQTLAQLSARLTACITHLMPGRTGHLQRGVKAQMPALLDDLDSWQLASHLSAKYEQAALSGASLQDHASADGTRDSIAPQPPLAEWPEVSEPLPACLAYLAAASAAASSGEWLQCISHLVALQRMTALEAACHAAVSALTGFAAAAGARCPPQRGPGGSRPSQGGSDALLTSMCSIASRQCATTATGASPSTHTPTHAHSSFCSKVLSSASSASDGRVRACSTTQHDTTPSALVRHTLMSEDSGYILSSAMQNSGFEMTFPAADDMMSQIAHNLTPSRGANSVNGAMMKTDDDLSLLNYEILDTAASSKVHALSTVDAQCMGSMKACPGRPGGTAGGVASGSTPGFVEPHADAVAAAAASDAVLGALARAVDESLPQRAGVGAGPLQVHVSLLCACPTSATSNGAAATAAAAAASSVPHRAVIVHISPVESSESEATLAAMGCNAWGAAPGVPDLNERAFDADTYQSPECMHGVRRALADALHCAKGAAGCPDTVWHGAADKLRPEALCVVSAKNVSPHALQCSDSGGSVTSAIFAACRAPDDPTLDVGETEVAEHLIWPLELISAAAETISRCSDSIVAASATGSRWPPPQTPRLGSKTPLQPPMASRALKSNSCPLRKARQAKALATRSQDSEHDNRLTLPVMSCDPGAPTPDLSFNCGSSAVAVAAPLNLDSPALCPPEEDSADASPNAGGASYCPHYSPSLQDMLQQETVRHVLDAGWHPTSPNAASTIMPLAQSPTGHPLQGSLFCTANTDLADPDGFLPLDAPPLHTVSPFDGEESVVLDALLGEIQCDSPSGPRETPSTALKGSSSKHSEPCNTAYNSQGTDHAYLTGRRDAFSSEQSETSSEEDAGDEVGDIVFAECVEGHEEHEQDHTGSCLGGLTSLPSVGLGPQLPVPSSSRFGYKSNLSSFATAQSFVPGGSASSRLQPPGSFMQVQLSPRHQNGAGTSSSGALSRGMQRAGGSNYCLAPSSLGAAVSPTGQPPSSAITGTMETAMSTALSTAMSTLPPGDVMLTSEPGSSIRHGQQLGARLRRAGVRPPPSVLRTCFCLHSHVEDSQELS